MNPSIPELQKRIYALSDSPEKVDLLIELADQLRNSDAQQALARVEQARELAVRIGYGPGADSEIGI